jgi:hypothetical protein
VKSTPMIATSLLSRVITRPLSISCKIQTALHTPPYDVSRTINDASPRG